MKKIVKQHSRPYEPTSTGGEHHIVYPPLACTAATIGGIGSSNSNSNSNSNSSCESSTPPDVTRADGRRIGFSVCSSQLQNDATAPDQKSFSVASASAAAGDVDVDDNLSCERRRISLLPPLEDDATMAPCRPNDVAAVTGAAASCRWSIGDGESSTATMTAMTSVRPASADGDDIYAALEEQYRKNYTSSMICSGQQSWTAAGSGLPPWTTTGSGLQLWAGCIKTEDSIRSIVT